METSPLLLVPLQQNCTSVLTNNNIYLSSGGALSVYEFNLAVVGMYRTNHDYVNLIMT